MPLSQPIERSIPDHLGPLLDTPASQQNDSGFIATSGYIYSIPTPSAPLALETPSLGLHDAVSPPTDQIGNVYYPGMENIEQPMFDLNDLQNFFEWENSENGPPPTGVDGLGPLGWNNLSTMQ